MRKPIAEMSREEIESEIDWLQGYFDDCERSGQGINSKEVLMMRDLQTALAQHAARQPFGNEDRSRHYGLRVGDDVEERLFGKVFAGTVSQLHWLDNNGATIILADTGLPVKVTCEFCEIVKPVEEKAA